MKRLFGVQLAVALGLSALAGCKSSQVSLGVDVPASGSQALETATKLPTHSSAIVVNRIRLLVNEAKLQGGTSHEHNASGPYIIDLSADEIKNGAHRDFSVTASATATYGDAEIEIEPLDLNETGGDASAAEFDDFRSSGASVIVDGTFKGAAFTFTGHFKAEQGKEGTFDVASGAPISIAMAIDPATWFVAADGTDLDPTDATQHSAVAVALCKLIDTEVEASGPGAGQPHCVE
jgi:hypothetical protein